MAIEGAYSKDVLVDTVRRMAESTVQRLNQCFAETKRPHRSALVAEQAEKTLNAVAAAFRTQLELKDAWIEQSQSGRSYFEKESAEYKAVFDRLSDLEGESIQTSPDLAELGEATRQSILEATRTTFEITQLLKSYADFAFLTICEAGWTIMAQQDHLRARTFWEEVRKGAVDLAAGAVLQHGFNLPPLNIAGVELQAEFCIPLLRAAQAAVMAISKRSQYADQVLATWETLEMQCDAWVIAARQSMSTIRALRLSEA